MSERQGKAQQKKSERARGREQHEKVSERSREQERESEGKRESTLNCEWLTTLSEQKVLLHALSVYCSTAKDCALLRYPHLLPLPAYQHQPTAASSSWLRKHTESKGVIGNCKPRGMEAASEMNRWDDKKTVNKANLCFFFFFWSDIASIIALLEWIWTFQISDYFKWWMIICGDISAETWARRGGEKIICIFLKIFLVSFLFLWLTLPFPSDHCSRGLRRRRRDRAHVCRGELALPTISLKAIWILCFLALSLEEN